VTFETFRHPLRHLPLGFPSLSRLAERVWAIEHAFERARAQAKPEEDTRVRIFFVLAAFGVAFGALALGATHAALRPSAEGLESLPAPVASRTDLVDRNGQILATNLVHYGLYVDPDEVWDRRQTRRALLAAAPTISPERLDRALNGEHLAYVLGGLTPQERDRVHALGLPGVSFQEEDRRDYPLGAVAAHVIGFADGGGRGVAGVERSFDQQIGQAGRTGAPIALSIDLRVQSALEDELFRAAQAQQAAGAVGIVTDVHTGEILGMASWPTFDPNAPAAGGDAGRLDRAAAAVYEMGSTFKIFTMASALDSGAATLATTFDARQPLRLGSRAIHDDEAQNRVMTLKDVFIHSSNIGTAKLALQMGRDTLVRYFDSFGLFRPAQVELAESSHPIAPRTWSDNTVASTSFGQAISVTPLQLAEGVGAVLNGGSYVPLTLKALKPGQVPQGRRVVSPATTRDILYLMRQNVVAGTGMKADAQGLSVGGKTGTGQKVVDGRYSNSHTVASFAAVFPTEGPVEAKRYFVLILMDDPRGDAESGGVRTGAMVSAPVAGRVINRIAPFLGVPRSTEPSVAAKGVIRERSEGLDQ
jgi:cell division protein FtsI (penicillin-binding protein 3)